MPPPSLHARGRGRGDGVNAPRRRRKQKVEIIQPATIGEDVAAAGDDAEAMSLFSDGSLFSTGISMGENTRVSKQSAARHLRSDISMMSELTDLSDAASKMSIGR
mmetsp:Transcript_5236/g.11455  ORF Transcript_5236/g.11455 Transcript_5236/m.11455 type:complete len:105 (-) Transcript_5236:218-532(-)